MKALYLIVRLGAVFTISSFLQLPQLQAQVVSSATIRAEAGPNLNQARMNHVAATLPGGRLVVFGGHGPGFVTLSTAERFAVGAASFTTEPMPIGNDAPGVFAKLKDGRYLIGGGSASYGIPQYADCAIYDAETETFATTGSMVRFRALAGSAALSDGKVLVAGAWWVHNDAHTYGELYDPLTGTFSATGPLNQPRAWPFVIPTPDGRAIVVGGIGITGSAIPPTPELYDPQANTFTKVSDDIFPEEPGWSVASRQSPVDDCRMSDGRYLLVGSRSVEGVTTYRLIVFDPVSRTFSKLATTPDLPDSRTMNWWPAVLNESRTKAYIPGYTAESPYLLNVARVDLQTGNLDMPAAPAPMPANYSLYGATFSLLTEQTMIITGGTSGDNFSAVPNTILLQTTWSSPQPELSIAMYAGVSLSGEVGTSYRIEFVTDTASTNWVTLTNLTLTSTPYLYFDPASSKSAVRFYRAVRTP